MTRSKTLRTQYTVDIDFDSASKAWLANKIRLGCGTYKYKPLHNSIHKADELSSKLPDADFYDANLHNYKKNDDSIKPKNTNGVTHNYYLRSKKTIEL